MMHTVYIIILSFVTRTGCLERVLEQRDTNFLNGSWLATLSGERQFRSCHVVWNVPVHEQKIRASTFFLWSCERNVMLGTYFSHRPVQNQSSKRKSYNVQRVCQRTASNDIRGRRNILEAVSGYYAPEFYCCWNKHDGCRVPPEFFPMRRTRR
jgi:hypothetical protein